jgi:hypothetical protein
MMARNGLGKRVKIGDGVYDELILIVYRAKPKPSNAIIQIFNI